MVISLDTLRINMKSPTGPCSSIYLVYFFKSPKFIFVNIRDSRDLSFYGFLRSSSYLIYDTIS